MATQRREACLRLAALGRRKEEFFLEERTRGPGAAGAGGGGVTEGGASQTYTHTHTHTVWFRRAGWTERGDDDYGNEKLFFLKDLTER